MPPPPGTGLPTLAIVGNGITGITAARTVRKLLPDLNIHIISDESDYFFSRTALMYIYMGHLRFRDTMPYEPWFYEHNRLKLIRDEVLHIDSGDKILNLKSGQSLKYDILLLATGSKSSRFGWPGQDLSGVQGLYSLGDLDLLKENTDPPPERAVIVGGGLIGIELAEMLHTRRIPITFLVRESGYMNHILPAAESEMIDAEIKRHRIDLRLSTELREIVDNGAGRVAAVIDSRDEHIPCNLVGLTAGVSPNIDLLRSCPALERARGILVDRELRTSVPDIYAAGDCARLRNPDSSPGAVEQLWYTGRMQGEVAGCNIAADIMKYYPDGRRDLELNRRSYNRGIPFNSAKFFSIEFQTYGRVPNNPDPELTFFWKHPRKKIALRLVWKREGADTKIIGFNLLGLRFRHRVCEDWIREEESVEDVIEWLGQTRFDPEFYSDYGRMIKKAFRKRR